MCGSDVPAGATALWDGEAKTATCTGCSRLPLARGKPGASAGREHERRFEREQRAQEAVAAEDAAWRERVRAERPILGRLATALTPKPVVGIESQSTRAWKVGSTGEELLGNVLNRCPAVYALHDRAVPGSRANIDHIALGPAAVYVIDAKRYAGRIERRGARLYVAGRNRSPLLDGVRRQVVVVRAALGDDSVPVEGIVCFVGGDWPVLFRRPQRFGDVVALWPERLLDVVSEAGSMTVARTMGLARRLAAALPPA